MKKKSVIILFLVICVFSLCSCKDKINIFTDIQPGMNWVEVEKILSAHKIVPGEVYGHQYDWKEEENMKILAASGADRFFLCDILSFYTKICGKDYGCTLYLYDGLLFDMEIERYSGRAGLNDDGPAYPDRVALEKFILKSFPENQFEFVKEKSGIKKDVMTINESRKIEVTIDRESVWCYFTDSQLQKKYDNFANQVKKAIEEYKKSNK